MSGLLERIFGKKKPDIFIISIGAVPSYLDGREKAAREALVAETAEIRIRIRQGLLNLREITKKVAEAEQDEVLHPKLKSIAKNSLPQFVRAMNSSLDRDLPDDIDGFYPAAVECLKSCLNSSRGQGRYLHTVFPDEMKAVKEGIDAVGRDINEVTASLARYRNEKDLIEAVRSLHSALLDIGNDIIRAEEKDHRIVTRMGEISERSAALGKELAALLSDTGMAEVDSLKASLQESESNRDTALRTCAALSMTASHVFRKAEKIAVRQKHPSEISVLRHAMDLLSDHETPEIPELSNALSAAFPVAERMIASGEISLKNKEERAIFSDTAQFISDICKGYSALSSLENACRAAQHKVESHPLLSRIRSLEREKTQLEIMLKKEALARSELGEWRGKTRERISPLTGELTKKMAELVGGGVQLQIDDQRLA